MRSTESVNFLSLPHDHTLFASHSALTFRTAYCGSTVVEGGEGFRLRSSRIKARVNKPSLYS